MLNSSYATVGDRAVGIHGLPHYCSFDLIDDRGFFFLVLTGPTKQPAGQDVYRLEHVLSHFEGKFYEFTNLFPITMEKDLKACGETITTCLEGREIPLDTYTQSQLYDIVRMRVEDTFPLGLTDEIVRYVTDIVCEFDASKPKTSIEALKALWPMASKGQEIDSDTVRASTAHISAFAHDQDYMDTIDTISMNDFMTLLVLEAMTEHLMRYKTETYIDRQTLSEIVQVKCEELGVRYAEEDIEKSLQTLIFQSIVFESGYSRNLLYVLVPPEILYDSSMILRRELARRK